MAVALRTEHLFQFYWCGNASFFKAHLLSMVLDDFEKKHEFSASDRTFGLGSTLFIVFMLILIFVFFSVFQK